jgi:outer membrane murein-binding lipoprotein Lpp
MKLSQILTAVTVAALLLQGGVASAQSADDTKEEVRKLRAEVEALKAKADEAEVKAKDAVVAGDIPGSFRIPGSDVSIRIYGFAELTWVHDFKGDNSDIDYSTFAPYMPLKGTADYARKQRDYLTARTSRLGVEAGTPTRWGILGVKIEGDFNNEPRLGSTALYAPVGSGDPSGIYTQQATNSYGFRIRHAYGQFGGLLAGMTWSTFMDVDNYPETVDFNGPIGNTFIRQALVRYTYGTPDYGAFTVAAENSSSYVYDGTGTTMDSSLSRVPDFVVRWDKGFQWGSMSIRGMTQELRIDDGAGAAGAQRGWGVGSSALIKSFGRDFITVGVTYGDGIGRYLNYIEGAAYDAATRDIVVEQALGIIAGYQWKQSDLLRFNFVYGMTQNFDNEYTDFIVANGLDSEANMGRFAINRQVQQAHVGFFYSPLKAVDIGVEAIWAYRKTLAGETGDDIRSNVSFKYYIN